MRFLLIILFFVTPFLQAKEGLPGAPKTKSGLENHRPKAMGEHKTSHKGSYHFFSAFHANESKIELEDGSTWFALPNEIAKILDWELNDPLAILKGDSNSNYKYLLQNERTLDIVEVALSSPPFLDSFYRLTINDIDHEQRYLYLSDDTRWPLYTNWFEQEAWKKWYVGEPIIIGTNSGLFGPSDILINANSATYTPSQCVN